MQNRNLFFIIITAVLIAVSSGSCGEKRLAPELVRIGTLADGISAVDSEADRKRWREADSLLRSTDTSRLPENDRMYHSLLRVKVTDKAYLPHSGDTIIRPVVEYAEKHPRCGFYPEALYYAGRVYSDMGDSFTALSYFQKALDNFSDEESDPNLRCRILSQTAYLLNSLRLYKEAISHLEECIALNKLMGDSTNIFYNTQKLGENMLQLNDFDRAEKILRESLKYSGVVSKDDSLVSVIYLAGVKEAKENIDSALLLIRGIPEQVTDSLTRNMVLAYASDIYRKAGINDTSLIYAHEIINNGNPNNKIIGYQNILKTGNLTAIPVDSLINYVRAYAKELERELETNGDRLSLIQQAKYNYTLHERKRREEELRSSLYFRISIVATFTILLSIIVILYLLLRRKRALQDLQTSIIEVKQLKDRISSLESYASDDISYMIMSQGKDSTTEVKEKLTEEFKSQLLELVQKWIDNGTRYVPHDTIINSQAYGNVTKRIEEKNPIPSNDQLWAKLARVVGKCHPQFKERFSSLLGDNIDVKDYHIALLIKCGFSPTEISIVFALTPSAISQRRKQIGERIFGENLGSSAFTDATIQIL